MKTIFIASSLALVLGACTTMTDVMKVGPDTYMTGQTTRGGFTTDSEIKAEVIRRAQSYCAGQGRQMSLVTSQSNGTQGWTPQSSEVTFKCVQP